MSSCVPVRDSGWVCDLLFQAVGSESAEADGGGAIYATERPEGERHCVVVVFN